VHPSGVHVCRVHTTQHISGTFPWPGRAWCEWPIQMLLPFTILGITNGRKGTRWRSEYWQVRIIMYRHATYTYKMAHQSCMCTYNVALGVVMAILDNCIRGAHHIVRVTRCKLGSMLSLFLGLCRQSFSQNTLEV